MMFQSKLPADPTALVLGIVSFVVLVLGCCCGIGSVVALALSIIGLVMAQKSLRIYEAAPENYTSGSRESVNAGRIVCLVGIVLSALVTLFFLIYFAIVGTMASDEIWREWRDLKSGRETERIHDTIYNIESDTVTVDTVFHDSIIFKEVK